ncbi:MAG: PspC domain-containing protein [Propionibacteriaceae bacterium]|jgi:signal transduction histidine kinase/phage shock protein PspC (stress-responsive transcriptional regulator)|nr:PspC domain-containing protein [Propionibacteriaceae bacterium]
MSDPLTPVPPRAYRLLDKPMLAGVANGLSSHFGIAIWLVRLVLVAMCFWKLSGAIIYLGLWLILPVYERPVPLGLVAAERLGRRRVAHHTRWRWALGWLIALAIGMGVALLVRLYDGSTIGRYAPVLVLLGLGLAFIWVTRDVSWARPAKYGLVVLGVLLIWAIGTFMQAQFLAYLALDLSWLPAPADVGLPQELFAIALVSAGFTMAGLFIVMLPWLLHPGRSQEEQQIELIAQTKADMAAHLHDSVLQTLAVIQKRAAEPRVVAQLARRQEKELREWLYADQVEDESMVSALKDVISELELTFPVAVELVTVGDQPMTVLVDSLVRATREAILNAIKHSGAERVDVFAEIGQKQAEVFVRDRGRGFALEDIEPDRMGIRGSIIDRMVNYGGKVDIRSTIGQGTEVHLTMPFDQEVHDHD